MGIPGPYRPESLRVEVQSSFQGGRIVETEVGSKPVDDPGVSHNFWAVSSVLVIHKHIDGSKIVARHVS
jgi:hypothetical protein